MSHFNDLAEQMGVGADDEPTPIRSLLARADAVAARYDAAIAAHHSCADGGLCQPCAEWDERLLEIEARERARERTR